MQSCSSCSHNNCLPDCSLGKNNGLFNEESFANETQQVSTSHNVYSVVVLLSALMSNVGGG